MSKIWGGRPVFKAKVGASNRALCCVTQSYPLHDGGVVTSWHVIIGCLATGQPIHHPVSITPIAYRFGCETFDALSAPVKRFGHKRPEVPFGSNLPSLQIPPETRGDPHDQVT